MKRKVLIVRFSAIGDIVLTTPVVRCLKQQADTEVHFLCKQQYAAAIANDPYIDRLWTINKDIHEILPALRQAHFDVVLDLHNNLRSRRLSLALGVRTYRFPKLNIRKWLWVKTKINCMPSVHIVDRYMKTLLPLGVKYDGAGLDFPLADADQAVVRTALQAAGINTSPIALVAGAAHFTKRIPVQKLIQIAQALAPHPVVLLGGPDDKEVADQVVAASPLYTHSFCGALSLTQSAAMIGECALVITADTGLMHIASALRKPIVSVWGNTHPDLGMYPFYPDGYAPAAIVQVENLSCRPCSKIGYKQCPKGHFRCMNDISVAAITQKVEEVLGNG